MVHANLGTAIGKGVVTNYINFFIATLSLFSHCCIQPGYQSSIRRPSAKCLQVTIIGCYRVTMALRGLIHDGYFMMAISWWIIHDGFMKAIMWVIAKVTFCCSLLLFAWKQNAYLQINWSWPSPISDLCTRTYQLTCMFMCYICSEELKLRWNQ